MFVHNHPLTASVIDPQILSHLDSIDLNNMKASMIKKEIEKNFNKNISYA